MWRDDHRPLAIWTSLVTYLALVLNAIFSFKKKSYIFFSIYYTNNEPKNYLSFSGKYRGRKKGARNARSSENANYWPDPIKLWTDKKNGWWRNLSEEQVRRPRMIPQSIDTCIQSISILKGKLIREYNRSLLTWSWVRHYHYYYYYWFKYFVINPYLFLLPVCKKRPGILSAKR